MSALIFMPSLSPYRYDLIQICWDNESDKRPTFAEIVTRYHKDGLISAASMIGNDSGYVLLGPEDQKREDTAETTDFTDDDSQSLMDAILTHFQKSPPASFVLDTFLSAKDDKLKKAATLPSNTTLPDLEYYMDMASNSLGGSVFVNHMMHEYDNISIGEEEKGDHEKLGDHMTTSTDHMTYKDGQEDCIVDKQVPQSDLPKSNSDYILMQSADPINPPT
jgi:hypothetical protein